MPNLGPTELIIILLIVILLFGAKKIPEIAKGLGKGIKDFKGAMKDGEAEADAKSETKALNKPKDDETKPSA
jgi:sec-independent protein translocase protein TatA